MWGAAAAIGVGAIVIAVLVNRQRQAQTQAMIAASQANIYKPGGPLSFTDIFNAGGTVISTYFGGPAAGASFAKGIQ
jgi:hypothetical protein